MTSIEVQFDFYKFFDGLEVKYYAVTDNGLIRITPGMKFLDFMKKIVESQFPTVQ